LIALHSILIILIASFFYANYAAVGRNNRELLGYITPYKFINASIKYLDRHYFSTPLPFTILDSEPLLITEHDNADVTPCVTVNIV
jgi:lipid A ethanolaminephosphotransferase